MTHWHVFCRHFLMKEDRYYGGGMSDGTFGPDGSLADPNPPVLSAVDITS